MARAPRTNAKGIRRPKMTDQQRAEVVTRLAMYDRLRDIHADMLAQGVDIAVQSIAQYDPYVARGKLAKKWKDLFDKTREDFLAGIAEVPIAQRQYRLRRLMQIHDEALKRGALAEARHALEQAAKEVGSVYTNVSKHQPLPNTAGPTPGDYTSDERKNMLADRLAEAFERAKAAKPGPQPTVN